MHLKHHGSGHIKSMSELAFSHPILLGGMNTRSLAKEVKNEVLTIDAFTNSRIYHYHFFW
jgi:hypothetical protein